MRPNMTYQLYKLDEETDMLGEKIDSTLHHAEWTPALRAWARQRLRESGHKCGAVMEWNCNTLSSRSVEIVRM